MLGWRHKASQRRHEDTQIGESTPDDRTTNQAWVELFDFSIRKVVHEKATLAIRRPARRDPNWGQYFHLSVGSICVLAARHPVAPSLPVLDGARDHRTELERQSLGIFHWNFCSRALWDYTNIFVTTFFYNLLQWTATAYRSGFTRG